MIPFFRKLRKQLANDNKPLKYLRYAIGEIVLVVIGILIALSINNWNEQRKARKVETNILMELLATVQSDLEFQNYIKNIRIASNASAQLLIDHLNKGLPYNDSLRYDFGRANETFDGYIKDQAYQKAKNYGLDFIESDSLKELLTWTYEINTININGMSDDYSLYHNVTVMPVINQLFEISDFIPSDLINLMVPINYESLKTNVLYKNILRTRIAKTNKFLVFFERRISRMETLVELLQQEIENRS